MIKSLSSSNIFKDEAFLLDFYVHKVYNMLVVIKIKGNLNVLYNSRP